MLENFIRAVESNIPVNIFGCTDFGKNVYNIINNINRSVSVMFIDNSPKKQKCLFCGKKVYGIGQKEFGLHQEYFIIASFSLADEMEKELKEKNVRNEYIVRPEQITKVMSEFRRMPHRKLKFAVDLAEHCNLNCCGCDHFAPLAQEYFAEIDEYERDMKRLSVLFGDNVSQIKLEGGEPLLNSNIVDFIEITYRFFPYATISVYTNGILLLQMDDAFWKTCSKYDVVLEVTKYPIACDYDLVNKKAEEKGVILHFCDDGEVIKSLRHHPLDMDGKQNAETNFYNCFLANNCIMLKHGKLYTCTTIPNMRHFNHYFDKNILITEKDSIDIYSNVTSQEIMEFLSRPVPACRYCKVADRTSGHTWRPSKRDIGEWI